MRAQVQVSKYLNRSAYRQSVGWYAPVGAGCVSTVDADRTTSKTACANAFCWSVANCAADVPVAMVIMLQEVEYEHRH